MKKSILKNALYKITLNFFNLVIPLLIGPYVFRVLGSESIGRVKYAESIFNYFFIFASFGVYQYGLREISRIKHDKQKVAKLFTSLFTISLLTNLIVFAIFVLVSFMGFGQDVIFPVLLIFGINFVLNIFYVEWMNEAFESYDFITIKTIAVKLIYVILLISFIKNSDDYMWFAVLLVISTFLNNIISFVYVKKKIAFNFKEIEILPHIKPMFLVVIFMNGNILYTQLDIFMLGRFVSEASVSFYIMSQQMMMIISTLLLSIVQVTIPRLSHMLGSEDEESYLLLIHRVARVYFLVLFPAAVGLFIISDIGVVVYGGKEFAAAGPVLSVFSFYMVLLGIDSIFSNQVMYIKKKENILVRFIFISGLLNLILNIGCVYFGIFSPETAILTTAISTFVLVIMEYIYIRKKLRVPFRILSFQNLKYLLFSLSFFPVSMIIKHFVSGIFTQFVLLITVNVGLYVLLLLISKDDLLQDIISRVLNKLRKR
ncbi:oligosaccharide flippase family protein [Bacillus sp. JJ1566]|uniref:oligosaccharide flippase family protein n=1 Tax=Bacillus sp. JJ1566 TaxID=3122961 RepID=UPI002FFED339